MTSSVRSILPCLEPTASPRQPPALTDDLLEEIFLRVPSHAYLARASTACVSFRSIIADPSFLRRHRSRHPHLLLGFLGVFDGFRPVEAPHPNAPAARALGSAAGFSFDYLPRRGELDWMPCDVRDGRVLLVRHGNGADSFVFGDLAVCDPLSRRYLLLPGIPEDLLASVQINERNIDDFGAALVPSGDWEETSFRVLGSIYSEARMVVCIFSSTSGCWILGASTSWDALGFDRPPSELVLRWDWKRPQFSYSCCYWKVRNQNELLKLDMNTMEFSTVNLPADHNWRIIAIVEAEEGNVGMFSVIQNIEGTFVEYYTSMQNGSGRADEWDFENTTPVAHFHGFIGPGGGYVFLAGRPEFRAGLLHPEIVCSSLEIKTSNIERVNRMPSLFCYPYFGFPPSMSPRRIQGYEVG